jgi:hypothetical protein
MWLFENRVLMTILEVKGRRVAGKYCIMRSYVTCILHHILLG